MRVPILILFVNILELTGMKQNTYTWRNHELMSSEQEYVHRRFRGA